MPLHSDRKEVIRRLILRSPYQNLKNHMKKWQKTEKFGKIRKNWGKTEKIWGKTVKVPLNNMEFERKTVSFI